MRRLLRPLVDGRTWRATIHALTHLWLDLALWVVVLVGVLLTVGLAVTLVLALPVAVVTMTASRVGARMQRVRYNTLLGTALLQPAPLDPSGSWWRRLRRYLGRGLTWRELLHHLVAPLLGLVTGVLTLVAWALPLSLLAVPLVRIVADRPVDVLVADVDGAGGTAGLLAVGVALLLAAPWIVRGLMVPEAALARALLGPSQTELLVARVDHLRTTRAAALDAVALERQRIERNLHDGAQQRLVAVAMGLGMAKEKLDDDPVRARELVTEAHEEAKRAIVELRDLARGIHPAVLTDRGLDAAVSALAARCPVPVEVRVEVAARPHATIEATAYFVVSELLANLAKHAGAGHGWVTVVRQGDRLVVDVRDDGIGGADPARGSGLAGLRDRVAAVDGTFTVWSPPAGPTVIQVVLPCAS
jgi:signal transduction histidine kinase